MLLHDDKKLFREIVFATAEKLGRAVPIVEKDYYVTMILKQLAEKQPQCVFKGGTSLSKCHHVIDRFSEDIDIAFSEKFTQGMRRNLKNDTIAGIGDTLAMPILDWDSAKSRRDYNCYTFSYEPLDGFVSVGKLIQGVKMEVSFTTTSFPVVRLPADSYIYQFLERENREIVRRYGLVPFEMNVQGLDRTLADKVFALCDYYLSGKIKRYSRHIYDIYMLLPKVKLNPEFRELVRRVREVRAKTEICPSAAEGVDIPSLLLEILEKEVFRSDYAEITTYFQNHPVNYENAAKALEIIAESGMFA